MQKETTCECGWTARGTEAELIRAVNEHCIAVHDKPAPSDEEILASARPVQGDASN